jgi:hypothetical protein
MSATTPTWQAAMPALPALAIPTDAAGRAAQRTRLRAAFAGLLGDFPARPSPAATAILGIERRDGYRVERFAFDDRAGSQVPGVCYVPDGRGPFPAVLWCHWHGGDHVRGLAAIEQTAYTPEPPGPALARRGYVVLGVDAPGFGQRHGLGPDRTTGREGESSWAKHQLLYGRTLWGLMLHDDLCALDLLATRPEVDPARLGTAGISMGCLRALWLAALDERLCATVAICCLTRFLELIAADGLYLHGHYYYVPGLLTVGDIEAVLACIAPRALLSLNGADDTLTPVEGIRTAERLARPAWELDGAGDRLRIAIADGVGHAWTPAMWQESLTFLDRHLQPEG